MKKFILVLTTFLSVLCFAQQQNITPTVNPNPFERTDLITITVQGSQINEALWGVFDNSLYFWGWMLDANNNYLGDHPTNGTWTNSNEANKMTYNPVPDTYTITFVPQTSFNNSVFMKMGFLLKAKNGTGDKKTNDNIFNVGSFQVTLLSPAENSDNLVNPNTNISIVANNTGGNATYVLKANGVTIHGPVVTSFYTHGPLVTTNTNYVLEVTQGSTTIQRRFSAIVKPTSVPIEAMPAGMEDGINYLSDQTKAVLVLNAPHKDFVYVAGSFNNWIPNSTYLMKKDPGGKFWLELTGLTPGQVYTYQYWVCDDTAVPANSPKVVKTADPFSTLVLSPFDDPGIPAHVYPGLPAYPTGQQREVTVLQTGQTPYPWSNATLNFVKPPKEALTIYEVLLRDFDVDMSWQNMIDRIDYFRNSKINAIKIMPVMEFEGNESWGYNTVFHMALDKRYGPPNKFKEFIDLCHQNGIAVILDIALNHVFGRSPLERMWMLDDDGDGWANNFPRVTTENPYCNQHPRHAYNVGTDLNHQSPLTQYYTQRVLKHWIQEYKIDGFRWDLTKGFTQNCTSTDEACTNAYQQDRVDRLRAYADYCWSLDPTHYVIFEHLGTDAEEQQWANYRINETPSKGVMMWGKMTDQYNQLSMGWNSNNSIARVTHFSRGFTRPRLIGYAQSHDEEILMYRNLTFGNNTNPSHNVRNLNTALFRMRAIMACLIPLPGPKMIWHFEDLGYDQSKFTCSDGSINTDTDAIPGNCRLDKKPQPQWVNNWLSVAERLAIYNDFARMNLMKQTYPVFRANHTIDQSIADTPRIYIWDDSIPISQLKNVVIVANFDVNSRSIIPNFPYTGTWHNLMNNTTLNVTATNMSITVEPGGYRIFGNQPVTLSNDDLPYMTPDLFLVAQNPVQNNTARIVYNAKDARWVEFNVYAMDGRLMYQRKTSEPNGAIEFPLNLMSGTYILQMNTDIGTKETKVLLK